MPTPLDKIEHIVVLMLENRSFDNMLGWLYTPEEAPDFDGVAGKDLSNPIPPDADGASAGEIRVNVGIVDTHPNPDPGEEYPHINRQLFNLAGDPTYPPDPLPNPAPMTGFVRDYIETYTRERGRTPTYNEYAIIMNCFAPESLPVLSTLAKSYAVCDRWFCSAPTQTLPNRAFVAAATSDGYLLNEPYPRWLLNRSPTIFDRLEAAHLPWKIYHDALDVVSLTWLMQPSLWPYRRTHTADMTQFYEDTQSGNLPAYSFIEPRLLVDHNDQHPPISDIVVTSSVLAGELLINDIYQAIRNSPAWEKTLLIITYDEHGGCYDHVSPPTYPDCPQAIPPDDQPFDGVVANSAQGKPGEFDFRFDRLGVRVPAVLISAYTDPGTILHTIYDHTSIIKTVTERWSLSSLTHRDRAANDLRDALPRAAPRTDFPQITPHKYQPTDSDAVPNEPINHLQRAVLYLSAAFQQSDRIRDDQTPAQKIADFLRLIEEETEVSTVKTTGEAVKFMQDILTPTPAQPGCLGWLLSKLGIHL